VEAKVFSMRVAKYSADLFKRKSFLDGRVLAASSTTSSVTYVLKI
jgi:hypothetical protein